jgi:hypothetical protein
LFGCGASRFSSIKRRRLVKRRFLVTVLVEARALTIVDSRFYILSVDVTVMGAK